MLDIDQFRAWCGNLELSETAQNVVELIRSSDPARRVRSGARSVSGSYPSKKMGFTIQFESHKNELPAVYEMEHDEDVIEYYDQPPSFKLDYEDERSPDRRLSHPGLFRDSSRHRRMGRM